MWLIVPAMLKNQLLNKLPIQILVQHVTKIEDLKTSLHCYAGFSFVSYWLYQLYEMYYKNILSSKWFLN